MAWAVVQCLELKSKLALSSENLDAFSDNFHSFCNIKELILWNIMETKFQTNIFS